MSIKSCEKVAPKYYCEICYYVTSRKSSYDKHVSTPKHQKSIKSIESCEKVAPKYFCEFCDKSYKEPSGLWRHMKKSTCNLEQNKHDHNVTENKDTKQLTDLVLKVVEQNQELTKQIIELSKTSYSSINNSTVNSNNKFNLNVYLNETCKNAINISDFVSSLMITVSDLEETSRVGYAEGVGNIFLNGLKNLDVHDRPVHCADQKREILYIKDNNEWTKDTEDKAVLTKAIKQVAHKNIKKISEWQKLNPEYNDPESKQNDKYQQILLNSMSGSTKEESDKNYEKIIKHVVKNTVIVK